MCVPVRPDQPRRKEYREDPPASWNVHSELATSYRVSRVAPRRHLVVSSEKGTLNKQSVVPSSSLYIGKGTNREKQVITSVFIYK